MTCTTVFLLLQSLLLLFIVCTCFYYFITNRYIQTIDRGLYFIFAEILPYVDTFHNVMRYLNATDVNGNGVQETWCEWALRMTCLGTLWLILGFTQSGLAIACWERCLTPVLTYLRRKLNWADVDESVTGVSVCVVCLSALRSDLFLPCAHCVCCEDCSHNIIECPVCKETIKTQLTVKGKLAGKWSNLSPVISN